LVGKRKWKPPRTAANSFKIGLPRTTFLTRFVQVGKGVGIPGTTMIRKDGQKKKTTTRDTSSQFVHHVGCTLGGRKNVKTKSIRRQKIPHAGRGVVVKKRAKDIVKRVRTKKFGMRKAGGK